MLVVNDKLEIPLRELRFSFSRSGGPGGQNVNKVNTKVTMHWPVSQSPSLPEDVRERFVGKYRRRMNKEGELVVSSTRFRDQGRNVADCLSKLREMLQEVAEPPPRRKAVKPTKASKERRLKEKRRRAKVKERRRPPRLDD